MLRKLSVALFLALLFSIGVSSIDSNEAEAATFYISDYGADYNGITTYIHGEPNATVELHYGLWVNNSWYEVDTTTVHLAGSGTATYRHNLPGSGRFLVSAHQRSPYYAYDNYIVNK